MPLSWTIHIIWAPARKIEIENVFQRENVLAVAVAVVAVVEIDFINVLSLFHSFSLNDLSEIFLWYMY